MLVVFFRAVILYVLVTLCLRLMGKRQLGELQPAEFVITIFISNIAALPIEDTSIPIVLGLIPVLVLVAFELVASTVSLRFKSVRRLLSGRPVIVIAEGEIDQAKLKMIRFSIDDLLESLRQQGIFRVQDVWYAIVETNGKVSVLPKFEAQPVKPQALQVTGAEEAFPIVVISDGELLENALPLCNLTKEQAERAVRRKGLSVKQVFLMTADQNGEFYLVQKRKGIMR